MISINVDTQLMISDNVAHFVNHLEISQVTIIKTDRSSLLQANAIGVSYLNTQVISELSIAIAPAETTIIIGANGCGKSTLLKTLARVLAPNSGSVTLDGKDIHNSNTRHVAKKLGLLPQGPITPEGLTVRELVSQGRFPHQSLLRQWTREDESAVAQAMEIADILQFSQRQVDDLSGGQRQRCWIAMVLAQQTDLILLDEPTTFLDLKVQVDLMNLLAKLVQDSGRTLLMVLHDLNLAAAYADQLIMMKNGQIVHHASVERVFNSANLKQVFDLDVDMLTDPRSGRPVCVPRYFSAKQPLKTSTAAL